MSVWTLCAWLLQAVILGRALKADLRGRRIPNGQIIAAALVALGWQVVSAASATDATGTTDAAAAAVLRAVLSSLASAALMLALTMLLWRWRVFGAGDAKLMTVLAMFGPPLAVLPQVLLTLMAGGLCAMVALAWPAQRQRLKTVLGWNEHASDSDHDLNPDADADATAAPARPLPYSLAIALGCAGLQFLTIRGSGAVALRP